MSAQANPGAETGAPQTIEDLMLKALAMEREAVARYTELADMMEAHNNAEVSELFRKMAEYEGHHVDHILADMGWPADKVVPPHASVWVRGDAPESVPLDEMHYLMHPWHALQLARAAEERAEAFFANMLASITDPAMRKAAEEMRAEEAEHVALVEAWLAKVPQPEADWAVDPDPPRYED